MMVATPTFAQQTGGSAVPAQIFAPPPPGGTLGGGNVTSSSSRPLVSPGDRDGFDFPTSQPATVYRGNPASGYVISSAPIVRGSKTLGAKPTGPAATDGSASSSSNGIGTVSAPPKDGVVELDVTDAPSIAVGQELTVFRPLLTAREAQKPVRIVNILGRVTVTKIDAKTGKVEAKIVEANEPIDAGSSVMRPLK
jgi:hypothetical protein